MSARLTMARKKKYLTPIKGKKVPGTTTTTLITARYRKNFAAVRKPAVENSMVAPAGFVPLECMPDAVISDGWLVFAQEERSYRAYSTARTSLMTLTFISPGYFSSVWMRFATSRASSNARKSSTFSGTTKMRSSRPAEMA